MRGHLIGCQLTTLHIIGTPTLSHVLPPVSAPLFSEAPLFTASQQVLVYVLVVCSCQQNARFTGAAALFCPLLCPWHIMKYLSSD